MYIINYERFGNQIRRHQKLILYIQLILLSNKNNYSEIFIKARILRNFWHNYYKIDILGWLISSPKYHNWRTIIKFHTINLYNWAAYIIMLVISVHLLQYPTISKYYHQHRTRNFRFSSQHLYTIPRLDDPFLFFHRQMSLIFHRSKNTTHSVSDRSLLTTGLADNGFVPNSIINHHKLWWWFTT